MAYGYVPVRAHDHQEYAAGELVHASGGHVHFAHDVAERPELHGHGDDQERYADQETLVRYRQVHDVHVSDRLHFGEPDHHVDDQRVAHQPDHAHDHVQDLGNQVQRRLVPGRVVAVAAGAVVVRARRAVVVRTAGHRRRRFYRRPRGRQLHDVREFHRVASTIGYYRLSVVTVVVSWPGIPFHIIATTVVVFLCGTEKKKK